MADIRVPKSAGDEIVIVRNGDIDNPTVYRPKDGVVKVDDADAAHFLSVIDGAHLAGGKAAVERVADATS